MADATAIATAVAEEEVSPVQKEPFDAAQELPLAINGVTFMTAQFIRSGILCHVRRQQKIWAKLFKENHVP